MSYAGLRDLTFAEAAPLWLQTRTRISKGTRLDYEKNFKRLMPFFGTKALAQIHIGHILAYRETRQIVAGASRINHEISTVQQILKLAGLWDEIKKWYEPLPLPEESAGIALNEEEERYFFRAASQNSRWMVAYLAELLSRNTGAGPGEILHLRLQDIDFDRRSVFIHEGVKNGYRKRSVCLNDIAYWAICKLAERAFDRGSEDPEHYLLPARLPVNEHGYDPTKPQTSWKKAHHAICIKVAEKFPRLKALRIYDFRHTAATVMLEDATISYATIERQLGHRLGSNIKEKYSHIREAQMKAAAQALSSQSTTPLRIEPYGAPAWMRKVKTIGS